MSHRIVPWLVGLSLTVAACSPTGGGSETAVVPDARSGRPAGSVSTATTPGAVAQPSVERSDAGESTLPTARSVPPASAVPASSGAPAGPNTAAPVSTTVEPPTKTAPPSTAPPSTAPPPTVPPPSAPPPTDPPAPAPVAEPEGPAYRFAVESVTAGDLGASWRPGCPVGHEELRRLTVTHRGFDGAVRQGVLIVHREWAEPLAGVFRTLYESGFAIERIEPVDRYGADDAASMAANNTSAFNCRLVAGTSRWSEHSYGRAVDLNPLVNPYVKGSMVDPPGGAAYLDRTAPTPGLVTADGVAVAAFVQIGWEWGGTWQSARDYQHFSATGR